MNIPRTLHTEPWKESTCQSVRKEHIEDSQSEVLAIDDSFTPNTEEGK